MEVYNDLYDRVVNFFEVLRDPEKSERLASLLELTPYAQTAYARSFEIAEDPVEDALRFAVNSMMSYGGGIHKPGFKRNGILRTTTYPKTWREYPEIVRECAAELRSRNIEINNMDALQVMARYDSPDTLHYVDPPYVQSTRGNQVRYEREPGIIMENDLPERWGLLHVLPGGRVRIVRYSGHFPEANYAAERCLLTACLYIQKPLKINTVQGRKIQLSPAFGVEAKETEGI